MLLCIDVGNSWTCMCFYVREKDKPVLSFNMTTVKTQTTDELIAKIDALIKAYDVDFSKVNNFAISCVVPSLTDQWFDALNQLSKVRGSSIKGIECSPKSVKNLDKSIFDSSYPYIDELGDDYIASVIGAKNIYGNNCVVVDLGTATNIAVINEEGKFIGGLIVPGMQTSLNALINDASALSDIKIQKPDHIVGFSTQEAINSGVVNGEVARITGLYKMIQAECGQKMSLVLTGGLSNLLKDSLKDVANCRPDLVLYGLRIFAENF